MRCNSDDEQRGALANGHDGLFFSHTVTVTITLVNDDQIISKGRMSSVFVFTLLLRSISDVKKSISLT